MLASPASAQVSGDLVLTPGSILDFALGGPGAAGATGHIEVTGDLTLGGTINLSRAPDMPLDEIGFGYYRVITYGGNLTGSGPIIGSVPTSVFGITYSVEAGGGHVDLLVTLNGDDSVQTWNGGSGVWNSVNPAWQDIAPNRSWGGAHAVFKGQPGSVITVEGVQDFRGLQFVDDGYRLDGSGILSVDGSGRADNNAEIRVLAGETAVIATTIGGAGGIDKTQGGTLVLQGSNLYTGGTTISSGTVSVSAEANLGNAGGELRFNGGTLQNTASFTTNRAVTLGASGGTFQTHAALTVNGVIGGTGPMIKTGADDLILTGANTYGGGTTIRDGRVLVSSDANLGGAAGGLTLDGGTLANTAAFATNRAVTLAAGGGTFETGATLTVNGVIGGAGALIKSGGGNLILTGANAYGGGTTISDGNVEALVTDALGTGPVSVNQARLAFRGNASAVELTITNTQGAINFYDTSTAGEAVIAANGGGVSFNGGSSAGAASIATSNGGSLDFYDNATAGSASIANGPGGYTAFNGSSTADDATIVNSGLLIISGLASDGIGIGSLSGNGSVDLGSKALTLGGRGLDDTIGGTIGDGGTGGSLVKIGGGTLTLAGANSYGGGTTIREGVLSVSSNANLGNVAGSVTFDGGALANTASFATNRTVTLDAGGGTFQTDAALTVNGAIGGAGALIKTGDGDLILTGANTYGGGTTIREGRVLVSSDANLGGLAGGLTLDGGALVNTASLTSNRAIALEAGGGTFATEADLTLTGAITGPGALTKMGAGTLTLSGANAYGATIVEAGTLIGDAASIRGDVVNAGTLVFAQSGDGTFAGGIAGSDTVAGGMVKRGAGTLTLNGPSSLDWSVERGELVTTFQRFTGNATVADGATLRFAQSGEAHYAGRFGGNGRVLIAGRSRVELTGDSGAFAGLVDVVDSWIVANGVLGGSMRIGAGGVVGGAGTIGTTTVATNGTLAPGNSIGTLTIDGDLTFASGSSYQVEVDPAGSASDRLVVSGQAIIEGGSVAHIGLGGDYRQSATYTILTAGGGVHGQFAEASSDFAFLEALLGYSANAVTLTLQRNEVEFANVGTTRNQRVAGGAVEALGPGAPVFDAVVGLNAGEARAAFDSLSGEIHASLASIYFENSRFIRSAALDRMRYASAAADPDRGINWWTQGLGQWGRVASDGNAHRTSHSGGGLLMGVDAIAGEHVQLGAFAGWQKGEANVSAVGSKADIDSYHLGLYAGADSGRLSVRGGFTLSWHDADTTRRVSFQRFSSSLSSDRQSSTAQGFAEIGYRLGDDQHVIEPFAQIAHVIVDNEAARETGGAAALALAHETSQVSYTTLGWRMLQSFALGGMKTDLRASAGWRHAFGDRTPKAAFAFADAGLAARFIVAGTPIARHALSADIGLGLALSSRARFDIAYSGNVASSTQNHSGSATLSLAF